MLPAKIVSFLEHPEKSAHISFRYEGKVVKLFVRKSQRLHNNGLIPAFDVASISITPTGKGTFKHFFAMLQGEIRKYPFQAIFVESVLTERFQGYLEKIGGIRNDVPLAPSYLFPF